MEPVGDAVVAAAPPPAAAEQGEVQMNKEDDEKLKNELVLIQAQRLMDKITSSSENPNPSVLHALASILETQESRSIYTPSPNMHSNCDCFIYSLCFDISKTRVELVSDFNV